MEIRYVVHMKKQTTGESTDIIFTVPTKEAAKVQKAIEGFLNLAGFKVRLVNDEGEELFSVDEVFPDKSPDMLLRGYRRKLDMAQEELAKQLGITQTRVSELENGIRSISKEMARKLSKVFNIPFHAFL